MKTFSGTFNGQKYMGVEKPEGAHDFHRLFDKESNSFAFTNSKDELCGIKLSVEIVSILGTYQTKGKIDFEVNQEWVGYEKDSSNFKSQIILKFLSLLDRDSRMAFPLEDEMEGWADGIIESLTYEQHKEKVRPKSFLIILIS